MSGILAKIKHQEKHGVVLGIYFISEMSSLEYNCCYVKYLFSSSHSELLSATENVPNRNENPPRSVPSQC